MFDKEWIANYRKSMTYPWHKPAPSEIAEIEFDDDELLTIEKWPREVFRPHYHESFNWIVPMRPGRIVVRVEGNEVVVHGNQWLCILPRTAHTIEYVSDDMEVLGLFLGENDMLDAFQKMDRKPQISCPYIVGGKATIAQGLALQWGEYRFSSAVTDPFYEHFRLYLCAWLWRHYRPSPSTTESIEVKLRVSLGPAGEKTAEFISQNLAETPFPWNALVSSLAISQRTFQRLVLKNLGISPSELLTELRLAQAAHMLHDRSEKIADIAIKCGFSSQAHFSTSFKAAMGQTPRQYRQHESLSSH